MKFKYKDRLFSEVSKEWIELIPKTINENGCWIPIGLCRDKNGYIRLEIEYKAYLLHRLAMSVFYNVDYFDYSIETRHGHGCDKACFYWMHLTPGTPKENMQDRIRDGNHNSINKTVCPKCHGAYSKYTIKTGPNSGMQKRFCRACKYNNRMRLREAKKQNENK